MQQAREPLRGGSRRGGERTTRSERERAAFARSAKRFSEASNSGLVALYRRGDGSRKGALFPGVDARWWSRRRGGSNPRRGSRGTGSLVGVGALERIQGVGVWCGSPGRSQGLSGGSRSADGGRPRRSVGHASGRPFRGVDKAREGAGKANDPLRWERGRRRLHGNARNLRSLAPKAGRTSRECGLRHGRHNLGQT
jgi:hypothetical protein